MERQRREEYERRRKEELAQRKEGEQEEISRLRAKKRSLELELEAVVRLQCFDSSTAYHLKMVNRLLLVSQGKKHKQISDHLRDAQSKRRIQKAEVDLVNQKRDARIAEINTLQLEFEVETLFGSTPHQTSDSE